MPSASTREGSHVVLEFGKEFVLTIYFVPLLVTLPARPRRDEKDDKPTAGNFLSTQSASGWTLGTRRSKCLGCQR